MATNTLRVEVVSAEGRVWEGDALSVIARTTEGDVGIHARHEPFLATLVPCAAEVLSEDGRREVVAVDGGFISVSDNRVAIIAQFAQVAEEISMEQAEREQAELYKLIEDGDQSVETQQQYMRARAQVKAAAKYAGTTATPSH